MNASSVRTRALRRWCMKYPEAVYINHAGDIISRIRECNDYPEFLVECRSHWNRIKRKYDLDPVRVGLREYREIKNDIDSGRYYIDNDFIKNYLLNTIPKICETTLSAGSVNGGRINVVSFLKESFTGRTISDDIAICPENMSREELKAVLVHEITHWIQSRVDKGPYVQDLKYFLVRDGIACAVSQMVCRCSERIALNMSEDNWHHCHYNHQYLKGKFRAALTKDVVCSDSVGNRSEVEEMDMKPFDHYKDYPFSRYGYYLGYHFALFCIEKGYSIKQLILGVPDMDGLIEEYLASDVE